MAESTSPKPKGVSEIMTELREPFDPVEVQWRIDGRAGQDGKARCVPYVDARTVIRRLNMVLGGDGWQTRYKLLGPQDVQCRLMVRFPGHKEWVSREDVGESGDGQDNKLKSAFSDSLKRAAVQFGVGAYIYRIGAQWLPTVRGEGKYIDEEKAVPQLEQWALPEPMRFVTPSDATRLDALVRTVAQSIGEPHVNLLTRLIKEQRLIPDTSIKAFERRHYRAMMKKLNEMVVEQAKKGEAKPAPADEHIPVHLPQTGKALYEMLVKRDRELFTQKKIHRIDELVAHVLACGVKHGYSTSIDEWKGQQIVRACQWAADLTGKCKVA
jgi:hypothetical protein